MNAGAIRRGFGYIFDDLVLSLSDVIILFIFKNNITEYLDSLYQMDASEPFRIWEFYKAMFVAFEPILLWTTLFGLLIFSIYGVYLPVHWNGQTVGRKVVGVRVVSVSDRALSLKQMFLREFVGKVLWWIATLGLGILVDWFMIGLRKDKRALRDLLAGTRVELLEGEYVKSEFDQF